MNDQEILEIMEIRDDLEPEAFAFSSNKEIVTVELNFPKDCEISRNVSDDRDFEIGSTSDACDDSSIQTPTKQKKTKAPYIGKVFDSIDDAKSFYIEYGKQEGFCVRVRTTDRKQPGSDVITSCLLVCAREGIHDKRESNLFVKSRNTSTIRCECNARMRVTKRKNGNVYEVTMVETEHSHNLVTPSKMINMRVNRCLPEAAKKMTMIFHDEGLSVAKVASVFGGDTIGFNAKDCHNHFGAARKRSKEGDATAVLNYFKRKSAETFDFYYAIQSDDEGRAVNFFWADGHSCMQYEYFGDVVSFDTTYRTNIYEMPFSPFTGVNHHRQSIQFGCALLLDETEETFVWLFQTWLGPMRGRHPTSILTDQDRAMAAAIAKVFPTTQHRFCLWHVTNKFPEKLSHVIHKNDTFSDELKLIISCSYRIDDFEKSWNDHMTKYKLENHSWINEIYEARRTWVPVYHLDTFYAGMNTTGRSESMNSYYDKFVKPTTTLAEFVYGNEKLLDLIAKHERDFGFRSEHTCRIVPRDSFLLKHAAKVYTINVYDRFKEQYVRATSDYKIDRERIGNNGYNTYTLISRNTKNMNFWNVNFNPTTLEGECECKCFQFKGYLCGHLLKVLLRHDIDEIPNHFIMKRFMQRANTYRAIFEGGLVTGHENSEALRVTHSCRVATQLAFDASTHDETYTFLMERFDELSVEIANRKIALSKGMNSKVDFNEDRHDPPIVDSQVLLLNPNISQTKGRPKDRKHGRIKGGRELSQEAKPGRHCKGCGLVVRHDIRNCPENLNRKKK